MANVLVLYYYLQYPPRAAHLDHLYALGRYSKHNVYYLNLSVNEVPQYVQDFPWDLIVFHDLFVCSRWSRPLYLEQVKKVRCFKYTNAVKVVVPQDEFLSTDLICDLINEFGLRHVFSCAAPSEWSKIYRTVDLNRVQCHQVLTGYIDENMKDKIASYAMYRGDHRGIDIGYRTHPIPYWLGRHAILKEQIAPAFQKELEGAGLISDISCRSEDTITGDNWFKFLLNCKYQLGIEGGASILDWDGTYQASTVVYLGEHPNAPFEEVERHCFPNVDGSLRLFALSPRHFECALTKTCQILVEGDYNGVFKPWQHYIPVKKDLSNIAEVIEIVKGDKLRQGIVERVWKDIVDPNLYTYRAFADYITSESLDGYHVLNEGDNLIAKTRMRVGDWLSWKIVQVGCTIGKGRRGRWVLGNLRARKW